MGVPTHAVAMASFAQISMDVRESVLDVIPVVFLALLSSELNTIGLLLAPLVRETLHSLV